MEPRRFITTFTSARYLSLSWASLNQSIPSHPTSWRSILILFSHLCLGLPSGLFPSGFPHQNPVYASPLPHTRYVPRSSHSSRFYHPKSIGWAVQIIGYKHTIRICDIQLVTWSLLVVMMQVHCLSCTPTASSSCCDNPIAVVKADITKNVHLVTLKYFFPVLTMECLPPFLCYFVSTLLSIWHIPPYLHPHLPSNFLVLFCFLSELNEMQAEGRVVCKVVASSSLRSFKG